MLKIKNLELVVPWSIEPTNSSELPISMLFDDVRETVIKSILHQINAGGRRASYVTLVGAEAQAAAIPCLQLLISCQSCPSVAIRDDCEHEVGKFHS